MTGKIFDGGRSMGTRLLITETSRERDFLPWFLSIFLCCGIFLVPQGALALTAYGDGARAEAAGNFSAALQFYQSAANEGSSDAMYALGRFHRDGLGGAKPDPKTAFSWFLKAAKKGNVFARYEVGAAYRDGTGVARDTSQAKRWFYYAAKYHGPSAFALFQLVGTDDEKRQWLQTAADLMFPPAYDELARAYAQGDYGFPQDPDASAKWAASLGAFQADQP